MFEQTSDILRALSYSIALNPQFADELNLQVARLADGREIQYGLVCICTGAKPKVGGCWCGL